MCKKGLGSNPVSYTFLFILFYFIILLGMQTDRPIEQVCQHQLSFLFYMGMAKFEFLPLTKRCTMAPIDTADYIRRVK